ncbi:MULTISPECIES: NAD(P)/FAD-dependent oxidoreductase [Rhizobium]|uniref:FAD dependent oxidoreductase protein n=1 Tax=Rhizobium phaseoli TaxID=396 RepID=A0A192TGV7_9HYPH|nr:MULTISPECIES: FAD-dependent oxidoreductase [Rhizobium]MDH6648796.1 glycine/D-amino acid oxidase-like deaminating enzyme [Rhizobium esperanzae]ANL42644.1 FAD dependent oxidoreductase protein [Rhizobium phaseoli]ANL55319.1 FAD dependent oxidoreductase protein [Rhizobium phaseoli]ANL61630.1 FAD dependent oxidoreductase protein [Rhizobium phaseoli]ANL86932.1 FAD dependent oxidoreductase protein [Rhizobium phaseoli]
MNKLTTDIAVIGGGVIGVATALRLRADGRDVVLIEPNKPGSGASYGNAGTIADYAIIPVGTPAVLKNLAALLLNSDSPLSIRKAALPTLFPWLVRFAYESLPHRYRDNASRIANLLSDASSQWLELAAEIGASDLLSAKGCLYLYQTSEAFKAAASDVELRRNYGIAQQFLTPDEVQSLEPRLPQVHGGGLFFPKAINFTDPGELMSVMEAAARQAGVEFVRDSVTTISRERNGVRMLTSAHSIHARAAVIAAGAHSRGLALQLGERVLLDTERGYHLEFDMETPPVERPVCPTHHGFYFCPMRGRLRVAGTVELGGITAPSNPRRLEVLLANARRIFPTLGEPSRAWMGFRPSMPDSVPVIRPSKGGRDVVFAFGHGHIGLTLAPRTARMVSSILAA